MNLLAPMSLRVMSAKYVAHVLALNGGNKTAACSALGIAYHTLNGYLQDYADTVPNPVDQAIQGRPENAQGEVAAS